jgi:hypothetical protein
MALYFEVTIAPTEVELEEKLIFDRRFGEMLLALDLVAEQEIEMSTPGEAETEHELETDLAIAWFATERLSVGAELRTHTEVAGGEYEHTAFFFGPTVSYAAESYWLALGVQGQLFAIQGEGHGGDDVRDLHEHEMVNARVLVGLHLD